MKDYTAYIPWQEKLFRAGTHIPAGIIIILACRVGWIFGLVCFGLFSVYEINEDRHLHDMAFLDIAGAMIGAFGAVVVFYILGDF